MNTLTWTVFIGLAVLLYTAQRAEGIKCYDCTKCDDSFEKAIKDDCKSCTKTKVELLGVTSTSRSCSPLGGTDGCVTASMGVSGELCTCSTDLCNGAEPAAPAASAAPAMISGPLTVVCILFTKI